MAPLKKITCFLGKNRDELTRFLLIFDECYKFVSKTSPIFYHQNSTINGQTKSWIMFIKVDTSNIQVLYGSSNALCVRKILTSQVHSKDKRCKFSLVTLLFIERHEMVPSYNYTQALIRFLYYVLTDQYGMNLEDVQSCDKFCNIGLSGLVDTVGSILELSK